MSTFVKALEVVTAFLRDDNPTPTSVDVTGTSVLIRAASVEDVARWAKTLGAEIQLSAGYGSCRATVHGGSQGVEIEVTRHLQEGEAWRLLHKIDPEATSLTGKPLTPESVLAALDAAK